MKRHMFNNAHRVSISTFAKVALVPALTTLLGACGAAKTTRSLATTLDSESPLALRSLSDEELFKNNSKGADSNSGRRIVPEVLQQEIKQQFLASLSASSNAFREIDLSEDEEITFTELNISRVESNTIDIGFDAELQKKQESKNGPVAGAAINFRVEQSLYNILFSFKDEVAGEIYRIPLSESLRVLHEMKISAKANVSLDSVPFMQPPWLAATIAVFFKDINLALKGQGQWNRSSDVSSKLTYKGAKGDKSGTAFMSDLSKDVVQKLCLRAAKARGLDSAECKIHAPDFANPTEELKTSLAKFKVLNVTRCERTGIREFGVPIYKFYAATDGIANNAPENSQINVFIPRGNDWVKTANISKWATSLGETKSSECLVSNKDTGCLVVKYGANLFEDQCDKINSKAIKIGLSTKDTDIIYGL